MVYVGADAMMLRRINPNTSSDLLSRVKDNLHFFATKGLRTLVIGTRSIPPDVYADWSRRYDEAQGQVGMDNQAEEKVRHFTDFYKRFSTHLSLLIPPGLI